MIRPSVLMQYLIKQSSATRPLLFLLVKASDHISPLTGASPTAMLSKNGATFASAAGVVSELANGWYAVAANVTDNNTLGPIILHAAATGADPCNAVFEVVTYDPATLSGATPTADQVNNIGGVAAGNLASYIQTLGANILTGGQVSADTTPTTTSLSTRGFSVPTGTYVGQQIAWLVDSTQGIGTQQIASLTNHGAYLTISLAQPIIQPPAVGDGFNVTTIPLAKQVI
jgi:hypothetical protein